MMLRTLAVFVGIYSASIQLAQASSPASAFSVAESINDGLSQADQRYGARELMSRRSTGSFAESIKIALMNHQDPRVVSLGGNEKLFKVPNPTTKEFDTTAVPVGLFSHKMCPASSTSLGDTIGHSVEEETIRLANDFADKFNELRRQYVGASQVFDATAARAEMMGLYARLTGCLAYIESLTTADMDFSKEIASQVAPVGYSRPDGVLFYLDSSQSNPDSRLNIGLYQFSPVSSGNVQACIRNWNQIYPHRSIDEETPSSEMIRILGDSSQEFNAFCGIDKILQSFYVQVNTRALERSHPWNRVYSLTAKGGTEKLRLPEDRCVTLHFNRKSYNHFGPFQNSTRKNMKALLQCTLGR